MIHKKRAKFIGWGRAMDLNLIFQAYDGKISKGLTTSTNTFYAHLFFIFLLFNLHILK